MTGKCHAWQGRDGRWCLARALSYTSSLTCSISATAAAGNRSMGVQPGRCTALRLRTITLLSLHTARRVRRSTSSGAVQRPR